MKQKTRKHPAGYTLIELIIVMVIIAILAGLISGNFLNSLQKGRDGRRKNDLSQVQRALEIYYEDYKQYPTAAPNPPLPFGSKFCNGACIAGSKVYMVNTPNDPNSSYAYQYLVDPLGQYYYLLSCIENYYNDKGVNVSSGGYCSMTGDCGSPPQCGGCGNCKFYVGSPNAMPLVAEPPAP